MASLIGIVVWVGLMWASFAVFGPVGLAVAVVLSVGFGSRH